MFCNAVLALAASLVVGQAEEAKAPANEILKEFAASVVGSWETETLLIEDWPGIGKKGDRVAATITIKPIVGAQALEGEFRVANASGKWFTVWDPAVKALREFSVDTYGIVGENVIKKEGGKWVGKGKSIAPDGVKRSGTNTMTVVDGGNGLVQEGSDQVRDGQALPNYRDVWKRTKK
jgi:hypothetical protein